MQELSASYDKLDIKLKEFKIKFDEMASVKTKSSPQSSTPNQETETPAHEQMEQKIMQKMQQAFSSLYGIMADMNSNVHRRVNNVVDTLYKHTDPSSHLPPIKGAAQMQKCLASLGLDGDHEVKKNQIYCSARQIFAEIDYIKKV